MTGDSPASPGRPPARPVRPARVASRLAPPRMDGLFGAPPAGYQV